VYETQTNVWILYKPREKGVSSLAAGAQPYAQACGQAIRAR